MDLSYGTEEFAQAYREMLDKRLAEETRPYLYFSPEWIGEYEKATQNDADYKEGRQAPGRGRWSCTWRRRRSTASASTSTS